MSSSDMTIKIDSEEQSIDQHTMYGMRYPNGEIRWVFDAHTNRMHEVRFAGLAASEFRDRQEWDELLTLRAQAAQLNMAEYKAQHQLVKRTVIVSITTPEDVK